MNVEEIAQAQIKDYTLYQMLLQQLGPRLYCKATGCDNTAWTNGINERWRRCRKCDRVEWENPFKPGTPK